MAVGQTECSHHLELRHHVYLPGNRDGHYIEHKQQVSSLKLQLCKRIRGKTGSSDLKDHGTQCQLCSIEETQAQRLCGPDTGIVLPMESFRNQTEGDLKYCAGSFQGRGQHPDERHQHHQCA